MTISNCEDHTQFTEMSGEISTVIHSVPSAFVVRRIMLKRLPIPFIVFICGIAVTAYLALGDWRWLVVLLMLIFVVGFMLFAFAWICAISNPIAIGAVQLHKIILHPDRAIVIQNESGTSSAIALHSISDIDVEEDYIIIKFTPENGDHSKKRRANTELFIPISSFYTTDDARRFYASVSDNVTASL